MRYLTILIGAALLCLSLLQCSDNSDTSTSAVIVGDSHGSLVGDQDSIAPVMVTDVWPRDFELLEVTIDGHLMAATVRYSGGCSEHFFGCYMTPAAFLESDPVQASLYIKHCSEPDYCDAIITKTVNFELTPVADLYLANYGTLDPIILNVYEFGNDNRIVVSYNPALE